MCMSYEMQITLFVIGESLDRLCGKSQLHVPKLITCKVTALPSILVRKLNVTSWCSGPLTFELVI